ncbi:hypothetical protein BH10PAT1_BH10PAT1_1980 [soil metagenome]
MAAEELSKKTMKVHIKISNIIILLLIGFILRLILSPFGTLTLDQNTYIAWSSRLITVGFSNFYKAWSDYLPGYLYILAILAEINKLNIIPQVILYKLPAILSDLATGFLIYKIVRKLKTEKWGLVSAGLYLFNPAVIANSTIWGQVDGITSLFSLLAIYAMDTNPLISAIALAYGAAIKPQVGLVALIIFILMIRKKWSVQKMVTYILESGIIFAGLFVPFMGKTNLITFIMERMNATLGQYPYTSINAFNFWGFFGTWEPDQGLQIAGVVVILLLFFVFGIKMLKRKGGEYTLLAFTYAASFLFMTRMHERHMLPTFAPLTIAVALEPTLIFALVGFSFIYVVNLIWAWSWVTNHFNEVFGQGAVKIISLVNVLLLGIFLLPKKLISKISFFEFSLLRGTSSASRSNLQKTKTSGSSPRKFLFEKTKISSKNIKILFVGVIIFAAITRFYNLGDPPTHYFDEVYHAFTAQQMLHGNTFAWEWWNTSPTGFAYEWTHPPLAKEGMVLGMLFMGENSLGWRVPGALLGVGSVILVFFIAKEIFDDELLALIASAVFSLDGLVLVLSRIGMNDSYMLFFALASIYSYLKKRNFWAAIFFGLSVTSKWSGLWVAPIIFVAHFVYKRSLYFQHKRKLNWSYALFFILPLLIYISSYFPIFTSQKIQKEYIANTGYLTRTDKIGIVPLDMFLDVQKQMWWYHTRLKATHPYSSLWYTWPFLVRPIYLYTSDEVGGEVARIYAMGNPIVFWGGITSVAAISYFAVREKNKKLGLVAFAYLVFFTPWAISPRIMFLYHYLPSIPFMAIAMAYVLRRFKELLIPFLVFALILFIYFYPHWAGLKIPVSLDTSYYWFPSWR